MINFVYYSLTECNPCRRFNESRVWETLEEKYKDKATFFRVLVDRRWPDTRIPANKDMVKTFPAIVAKEGSTLIASYIGNREISHLSDWMEGIINPEF